MQGEKEVHFHCPFCGEPISMLFELYHGGQEYIEDCQVCCSPILIKYSCDGEELTLNEVKQAY